jgi:hypothetical protein
MEVCPCLRLFLHTYCLDGVLKLGISATGLVGGIVGDDRIESRITCRVLADGYGEIGNVGKRRCFRNSLEISRDREEPGWAIENEGDK